MAFLSRAGSMLRQSVSKHIRINYEMSVASPSIFQLVRCMSSDASSKVFVGGLAWATDDTSLREAFSAYGEVYEARVIVDRETGRSRGFGFVTFADTEAASAAIQAMDPGWGWRGEQLLCRLRMEVDEAYEHPGIHIIGATNRPDLMDEAILRPERFGHHFHVPLPNQHERGLILEALVRKKLYADADVDVELTAIAQSKACADFSGGDLSNLVDKAYKMAFDEESCRTEDAGNEGESHPGDMRRPAIIKAAHFQEAAREILLQKKEEKKIVDYLGVSEDFIKERCRA